jgi:hypothetical protein
MSGSGTPLCPDAAGSGVLGCCLAGPGSDLSEEPVWGCEPAALESESFPRCPPGPVVVVAPVVRTASMSMVWKTMSDGRRFTRLMASVAAFPSAFLRS